MTRDVNEIADDSAPPARLAHRLAISLVIALFTLIGLVFAGVPTIGPRNQNGVSSPTKDGQPTQVTTRDGLRAVVTADRKAVAKTVGLDDGAAPILLASGTISLSSADIHYLLPRLGHEKPPHLDYFQPRGPPAPIA
ncbi:hypothetical protein [Oryzifoliimicrobium ureilyticus]|uniref:hypothetical protein n=1 Tax=Oryzifoliimicrobium ureilyticus TaxID=3113724 RepID=UPI0030765528